jgi:hypothetical protein
MYRLRSCSMVRVAQRCFTVLKVVSRQTTRYRMIRLSSCRFWVWDEMIHAESIGGILMIRTGHSYSYRVVVERALLTCRLILVALLVYSPLAYAAEPLPCNDKRVLHNLKRAYEVTLMGTKSGRQFQAAEDVHETGSGPPPPGVNQYTPSKDHYNKSRYCEARIRLDNGETDQAYFRMDGLKDGPETDFNFDPCFLSTDVSQDRCADQRPGQ